MSVNRESPHLHFIFEDKDYRDLMIGFQQVINHPKILLGDYLGGYRKLEIELTDPKSNTLRALEKFKTKYIIVLMDADLDNYPTSGHHKILQLREKLPQKFKERIFLLGSLYEAKQIKQQRAGKISNLGQELANECQQKIYNEWQKTMFEHNLDEIARLKQVFNWE